MMRALTNENGAINSMREEKLRLWKDFQSKQI